MKLQILELESQDDRASVRDRLAWSQAPRVVLVYPNRGRTRLNQLDLVLLHREAAHRGRQLGMVTRHPILTAAAEAAGIPRFPSIDEVPEGAWPPRPTIPHSGTPAKRIGGVLRSSPRPPRSAAITPLRGAYRWLWFGAAVMSLLVMAAAILPSAKVVLTPVTERRDRTLILTVAAEPAESLAPSTLPSRQVQLKMSGSLRLPTTGEVQVPAAPAVGTAVFTNLTAEEVDIDEGTSLRASNGAGGRFVTTLVAELPPGQGSSVSVPIAAAEPGSRGNLTAGSLDSIDGPLGLKASVSNPENLGGGSDQMRPAVAAVDPESLQRALVDQLLDQAEVALKKDLKAGEKLVPGSVRVLEFVDLAFDHQPGDPADSMGVDAELLIGALVLTQEATLQAAWISIQNGADPPWTPVPGSLSLGEASAGSDPAGQAIQVTAEWSEYLPVNRATMAKAIRGRPAGEASRALIESANLVTPPQVILTPAWLPRLPWLESRIGIFMPWEMP